MFKFRSYNVKKATEKIEKEQATSSTKTPSYSAMTLKKPPRKEKKRLLQMKSQSLVTRNHLSIKETQV